MNDITYSYTDKSKWPEGEWHQEPDKIQFLDETTGMTCLIVRGPVGALCGYVGVDESHPLFQASYSAEPSGLDVHGGLTFSGMCVENDKEHGICHVPYPGHPDRVWWLGFDCAHFNDRAPESDAMFKRINLPTDQHSIYRNVEYVKNECLGLAKQLNSLRR